MTDEQIEHDFRGFRQAARGRTCDGSHFPLASNMTWRNATMDSHPTDQTSNRADIGNDDMESATSRNWYCRSVATEHVRQLCLLLGIVQTSCSLVYSLTHPGYLLLFAVSLWFALRGAGLLGRSKMAILLTVGMAASLLLIGETSVLDLTLKTTEATSFILYANIAMLSLLAFADIYDRRY